MKAFKGILLVVISSTFIVSCVPAVKNANGLYEYDYCLNVSGKPSQIRQISNSDTLTETIALSGSVMDLMDKRVVPGALVIYKLSGTDKANSRVTDDSGRFFLEVLKGCYDLEVKMIGYTHATEHMCFEVDTDLEILMGNSGGYYTYGITSDRKLFEFQLRRRAKLYSEHLHSK